MATLNIRVDAETSAFLERLSRQTGRTKSEVVREALVELRTRGVPSLPAPPAETMAHLIGSWDSGGQWLSERTGARFAQLLEEKRHDRRSGRRGPARRAD
ncbi:MAG: ribbon-helix-helix protein, CopG family [Candidatus Binataceae bacterium]